MKKTNKSSKDISTTEKYKPTQEDIQRNYNVVGVLFPVTRKKYYFDAKQPDAYHKGDKVIVETVRGKEFGEVYTDPMVLPGKALVLPLKPVLKRANDKDIRRYNSFRHESKKAIAICKELIRNHNLDMKLVDVEYTFDKGKLIFYFTAEGRIDFRDLVKDLASSFRVRIELKQIGVRDEARMIGDIGLCGKQLCCRTHINKFDSVSVKMARDQGIVINPSKISGICGRLLCCMNYEYPVYEEKLKDYPAVGQRVSTPSGAGRVVSMTPLSGYLFVNLDDSGIMKFDISQVKFDKGEAHKIKSGTTLSAEEKKVQAELNEQPTEEEQQES